MPNLCHPHCHLPSRCIDRAFTNIFDLLFKEQLAHNKEISAHHIKLFWMATETVYRAASDLSCKTQRICM